MKVVSGQLGHSSLAITADTCTSILPAVARAAAEAVAGSSRGVRELRGQHSIPSRSQSGHNRGLKGSEPHPPRW